MSEFDGSVQFSVKPVCALFMHMNIDYTEVSSRNVYSNMKSSDKGKRSVDLYSILLQATYF